MNLKLLDNVVEALGQGHKLDAKYRDHALHGNWEGFRECHIQPDWLLIYLVENDVLTLTLVETRTMQTYSMNKLFGLLPREQTVKRSLLL